MTDTVRSSRRRLCGTWQGKAFAALLSVAASLALPQLAHFLGATLGIGAAIGEILLPMHLAVMLAGLFAGPLVGGAAGALSPAVSFLVSGMPSRLVLPFMTVELIGYGLAAGLLAKIRLPLVAKTVLVQIAGRALRAAAVLVSLYALGTGLPVSTLWTSVVTGIPGILLQWAFVPLFAALAERLAAGRGGRA